MRVAIREKHSFLFEDLDPIIEEIVFQGESTADPSLNLNFKVPSLKQSKYNETSAIKKKETL